MWFRGFKNLHYINLVPSSTEDSSSYKTKTVSIEHYLHIHFPTEQTLFCVLSLNVSDLNFFWAQWQAFVLTSFSWSVLYSIAHLELVYVESYFSIFFLFNTE